MLEMLLAYKTSNTVENIHFKVLRIKYRKCFNKVTSNRNFHSKKTFPSKWMDFYNNIEYYEL